MHAPLTHFQNMHPQAQLVLHLKACAIARGFGIDVAERLLGELRRDDHALEKEAARLRLEQVLETYTDITRFPQYVRSCILAPCSVQYTAVFQA